MVMGRFFYPDNLPVYGTNPIEICRQLNARARLKAAIITTDGWNSKQRLSKPAILKGRTNGTNLGYSFRWGRLFPVEVSETDPRTGRAAVRDTGPGRCIGLQVPHSN
jgi:hypothetical protein